MRCCSIPPWPCRSSPAAGSWAAWSSWCSSASRHTPRFFEGDKLPLVKAFQIGCCQILSIIPGVSRSGATILGGELLGVDRKAATLFTFYLAVPTMTGATILELHQKAGALTRGQDVDIAIGFIVSFMVAFFVIREFLHIVTKYGLKPFGWYRIAAGSGADRLSGDSLSGAGLLPGLIGIFALGPVAPQIRWNHRLHRSGDDAKVRKPGRGD